MKKVIEVANRRPAGVSNQKMTWAADCGGYLQRVGESKEQAVKECSAAVRRQFGADVEIEVKEIA